MDYFAHSSSYTSPLYSPEYKRNIEEYEKTAAKALRNINLLYNDIMTPKNSDSEDPEIIDSYENDIIPRPYTTQSHYLKTCCNSVHELCARCDRFISRCASCNQCKCCTTDENRRIISCKKRSKNDPPSTEQFDLKCTVPEPFSLCSKIDDYQKAKENKISEIKRDLETKIENELKVRANVKPVPKSTHLPLYNQMVQLEKQRKMKRKEECQQKLNNTKPFDLHSSSKNFAKSKSTVDLSLKNAQFRAKPIPKHILSNKISEKLKNKEEIRKLIISERAKETIEKSSSPFSQKSIPHVRSCIDLTNLKRTQNREASKTKDISEITKRLYVKKCTITMEDWNKRVLQVNADKEKISQKIYNPLNEYLSSSFKPPTKKEEMPFMYFPLRMSNASLLREKQIREKIAARKEKEKMKDDEIIKKKFINDIVHKLKNVIPISAREKEIEEKVKQFRISQVKRQQEYVKELEEIMKKVSEQNLLLERQSKVKESNLNETKESISYKEEISNDNETHESISSVSDTDSSVS